MAQTKRSERWYTEKSLTDTEKQTVTKRCHEVDDNIVRACLFPDNSLLWDEYQKLFVYEPPIFFPAEDKAGTTGTTRSNTKKEHNNKLLEQNNKQYRSLTENIRDAIWSTDKDFNLSFVSPSITNLLGCTPKEFLRAPIESHFTPEFLRKYQALKRLLIRKTKQQCEIPSRYWEFEWVRKDGRTIWVETEISPVQGSDGTLQGFAGSLREVTNRVITRDKLERERDSALEATRAKSDFLASMSHEIRTPMNGVLGMLQILKYTDLNPQQHEFVKNAINSGKYLLNLINDILDLSKIEAGKQESREKDIQIDSFMDAVIADCSSLVTTPDISIGYHIEKNVPKFIRVDEVHLRQILINLIGNAVKFTEQGQISLKLSSRPKGRGAIELFFTIRDTGIGISPDISQHLFKPFTQADGPLNRKHQGSGLGLSIVKKLVELMGGTVRLESEEYRGTTVYFTVSAKPVRVKQTSVSPKNRHVGKTVSPMQILVVEDEEVNALVVSAMLKHLGHSFTLATNGLTALQLIEKEKYDCILMDIQMPEMDGIETSRVIRSSMKLKCADIPIIALTAHAMKGDRENFLNAGMDDYLTKPLHIETLKEVLQRVRFH